MDPQSDGHGNRYLQKDRQDRLGELHENASDYPAEDGQHHPERKQQQHQKQQPHPRVQQSSGDFTNGHAAVPQAHDQDCHVVHAADQNRPQQHPDKGRSPPPHDGQGGPDNRAGAGDAGEVMTEDNRWRGGHKIAVVPQRFAWHGGCRIEPEEAARQPPSVAEVAQQQGCRSH